MSNKLEVEMFESWERKPTNTELLVSMLINNGLDLAKPLEYRDLYRIQPKITGVERRSSLCYWGRRSCDDINVYYNRQKYFGIDLLAPIKDLVESGIEIVQEPDLFLWICLKKNRCDK
jgi:hypothetical protein